MQPVIPVTISCTFFVILLLMACGCTSPHPGQASGSESSGTPIATPVGQPVYTETTSSEFTLSVGSVTPGSTLPAEFTCTGASTTPGVAWKNPPNGTKSFVLILDDPDAPSGTFTHWLLYNIPPGERSIDPDQPNGKVLSDGAQIGTNTAGSRGYYPPCPPPGTTHRYIFRLYAVDMTIAQPTADRASIDWALAGHILGEANVVTTFGR